MPTTYVYDKRAVGRAIKAAGGHVALARRAGFTRNTVRYWEHGMVVPTAEKLAKLASALGVPPSTFFRERA